MEGNELPPPLKEDADEFKNEWKKDANDRVCTACCCETTLRRYPLLHNAYVGAVCLPQSFDPLSQLNKSL